MTKIDTKDLLLDAFTWSEIKDRVQKVNPELASIIDEIDPPDECTLYVAKYTYGAQIQHNGELSFQKEDGSMVPFLDKSIDPKIQEVLGYNLNSNPVTMVLDKSLEMFMELEDRIVPFSAMFAGDLFGLWRILDEETGQEKSSSTPVFSWGLTSGGRSMFMLPKVSEALAHNKLKQAMRISVDKPKSLLDHWHVFREIAQQENQKDRWFSEVVYFSKGWVDHLHDPSWMKLRYYLLKKAWRATEFWRNEFVWNLTFSRIQNLRNIKASAYISDIVKHILAIAVGAVPGFRVAHDDSLGPISFIQKAYVDHYDLKHYAPIIMQPSRFLGVKDDSPVYYSLQYPSAMELSPKPSGRSSTISDLYDVRVLMNKYLDCMRDDTLNIEATPLYEMAQTLEMNYYHNNVELYEGMKNSIDLVEGDANFANVMSGFNDRDFPRNSTFVKGVIGISHKK